MKDFILKKRSIWFHIIVTYFTCGIWIVLYLFCKYSSPSAPTYNTNSNVKEFDTNIAGVTFDNRQELLRNCSINQTVFIKWDKDNRFSKTGHALAVFTNVKGMEEQLGYIPDGKNEVLFKKYENEFNSNDNFILTGHIDKITGGSHDKPTLGCVIKI